MPATPVLPPPADPGDVPTATTLRYQAEGSDALRDALAGNGPIARRTVTDPKEPAVTATAPTATSQPELYEVHGDSAGLSTMIRVHATDAEAAEQAFRDRVAHTGLRFFTVTAQTAAQASEQRRRIILDAPLPVPAILSDAYLAWVLGERPRRPTTTIIPAVVDATQAA
jgi:hypothetical protein